jgi:hypothetical protein
MQAGHGDNSQLDTEAKVCRWSYQILGISSCNLGCPAFSILPINPMRAPDNGHTSQSCAPDDPERSSAFSSSAVFFLETGLEGLVSSRTPALFSVLD